MKQLFHDKHQRYRDPSLAECLEQILQLTTAAEEIPLQQVLHILSHKGYAALLILLSFPFCILLPTPGFSMPFAFLLAFLGLRLALAQDPWWPIWLQKKTIGKEQLEKWIQKAMKVINFLRKITHPRLNTVAAHPLFHRIDGILVVMLSLLLALPLPIPLTNTAAALPILCIGVGLLEEDGLFILIGYFLSLLCFAFFIGLLMFTKMVLVAAK